jgi:hypothetical protein
MSFRAAYNFLQRKSPVDHTTKDLCDLSAQELFALARAKEQEEWEAGRRARTAQIEALRTDRRKLMSKHRKELAAIDAEIQTLGGRVAGKPRGKRSDGLSAKVLAILEASGETSTKKIRAELQAQGVSDANLNQTLAYLKRTGRVSAPRRAVYRISEAK